MPDDELESVLARCRDALSEISLKVPTLESGAPRQPANVYSLTAPAPPPKPLPAPQPPPPPAALPAPLPEALKPPEPPPEIKREIDVFPALKERVKAPNPPVSLWQAQNVAAPAPSPAPLPPPDRRRPAAAAAVLAALAFGVWWARRPAPDLAIDVDSADAMAVRQDKGDILVAEGKDLVDLSRTGRTLDRRPLDAPVDSLCWNQGSLWSADGRTPSIVEHADGGRATVFRLNHIPGALYVKDNSLWTSEKDGHVLHQFLISRSILGAILQPLDSFELSGLSPAGFTIDENGTLWLADEATRRLFRLRLENGTYKQAASAPLSPFLGPQGKLQDLTIDGDAVWVLAQKGNGARSSLRRIALNHLDWTP